MLGGVDGWNGCWVEWMLMGLGGSGWWVAAEQDGDTRAVEIGLWLRDDV